MWFTPLVRTLKSGSKRRWAGCAARSNGTHRPRRTRLQVEMLEDRRVLSHLLPLFDPFGPGLLSDGLDLSNSLSDSSTTSGIHLSGNLSGSPASSSTDSAAGTSSTFAASLSSGGSQGQAPVISNANSAVPNSQFLGAIANHPSPNLSGTGISPMLSPPGSGGPLSVTSINAVTTSITGHDAGYGIGIQSDGKIVVGGTAGSLNNNSVPSFAVVRYNPDLTLDTSYGQGGFQTTQITPGRDNEERALVLQPDGKAVVAGWTSTGQRKLGFDNFVVARYTTSGALDTTFGGGKGYVMTDVAGVVGGNFATNGQDRAYAVAVDGSGRIIAAGHASNDNSSNNYNLVALARYTSNGTLDTTFNSSGPKPGTVKLDMGSDAFTRAVVVDANGNYVVGGSNGPNIFLARFTSAGVLDTTFGANSAIKGTIVTNFSPPGFGSNINAIALDSSGRIVVGGQATNQNGSVRTMVGRFNSDGTLDTTFNGTGFDILNFADNGQAAYSVVIQPDGKIVAAGYANSTPGGVDTWNYAIARLNPDGTLDTTFNGTGMLLYSFGAPAYATSIGTAVALNSSGTIVETGYTWTPTTPSSIGTLAVQP
jgi:uncharacterized delta-60 repeat protein